VSLNFQQKHVEAMLQLHGQQVTCDKQTKC